MQKRVTLIRFGVRVRSAGSDIVATADIEAGERYERADRTRRIRVVRTGRIGRIGSIERRKPIGVRVVRVICSETGRTARIGRIIHAEYEDAIQI